MIICCSGKHVAQKPRAEMLSKQPKGEGDRKVMKRKILFFVSIIAAFAISNAVITEAKKKESPREEKWYDIGVVNKTRDTRVLFFRPEFPDEKTILGPTNWALIPVRRIPKKLVIYKTPGPGKPEDLNKDKPGEKEKRPVVKTFYPEKEYRAGHGGKIETLDCDVLLVITEEDVSPPRKQKGKKP